MRDDPKACSEVMLTAAGRRSPRTRAGARPASGRRRTGRSTWRRRGSPARKGSTALPGQGRQSQDDKSGEKLRLSANVVNACPPVAAGLAASRGRSRVGAAGGSGGGRGGAAVIRSLQSRSLHIIRCVRQSESLADIKHLVEVKEPKLILIGCFCPDNRV